MRRRPAAWAIEGVREALRLPWRQRVTLARTLLLGVAVEVGVRTMELPKLTSILGLRLDLTTPGAAASGELTPPLNPKEIRLLQATQRLMQNWPFADGSCLRLSLLLGHYLRRRGPVLRIGMAAAPDRAQKFTAHAWVEVGGFATAGPEYVAFSRSG